MTASHAFGPLHRVRPGRPRKLFLLAAGLLILLGALVRAAFLDYPLRYDEAWHYYYSSAKSLSYIATHFNHVLHSLLVRCTIQLFGTSPTALRLPAFAAGVFLIPLTGWLAWQLSQRRVVVLLSMLAAAGSSQLVEYSVNARGYSWLAVFATLATICTVYLIRNPSRGFLWLLWGIVGAMGAYAHAIMLLPMVGLGGAIVMAALLPPRGSAERMHLIRGLIVGSAVCGLITCALFIPILTTTGELSGNLGEFEKCKRVYREYLDAHGAMFAATWHVWVRHSNVFWKLALGVGLVSFVVAAARSPARQNLVPLIILVALPVALWLVGMPVVPPGWVFALPLLLVCSMTGICLQSERIRFDGKKVFGRVIPAVVAVAAVMNVVNVSRQSYLSTWDHELVDVEEIVAELNAYGTRRCALVSRYNPATRYYIHQLGVSKPLATDDPAVRRAYIVVGTLDTLEGLWNEDVAGFSLYGPAVEHRRFARSALYVAERG